MTQIEIDGVVIRDLRLIQNAKGSVREFVRSDDADFRSFGQVHVVETKPGIVRAWFRHYRQFDQLAPIAGVCRIGLFDDRPDSPTNGASMAFEIHADAPVLVGIPPMVWHGFATVGDVPGVLVQHNDQAFIYDAPDEEVRPSDDPYFPQTW